MKPWDSRSNALNYLCFTIYEQRNDYDGPEWARIGNAYRALRAVWSDDSFGPMPEPPEPQRTALIKAVQDFTPIKPSDWWAYTLDALEGATQ